MFHYKLRINRAGTKYLIAEEGTLRGCCVMVRGGWRVMVWDDWVYPGGVRHFYLNYLEVNQSDAVMALIGEMHTLMT